MPAEEPTDFAFEALDRTRVFEHIISQVSEAIMRGELQPGNRLPGERKMAEMFGVSRASVREALRALEVFGVLVARRGRGRDSGSTIAKDAGLGLTSAIRLHAGLLQIPVLDIVSIRAEMESFAARRAAERQMPQPALHEHLAAMNAASELRTYHKRDSEFHVALAVASGNALLPVLMESLRSAIYRETFSAMNSLSDWRLERDRLQEEHRDIVERVEAGQPEEAAAAAEDHIMGFYRGPMTATRV
jgi:DNA-binding FadR family transcriptional regulator